MYFPAKATQKRVFWGFFRIAFVISAVLLWSNERSKVTSLTKQLEEPSVVFTFKQNSEYVISYADRAPNGFNDSIVRVKVSTNKKLTNARLRLKCITKLGNDASRPVDSSDQIGWFRTDPETWNSIDIPDDEYFEFFSIYPADGRHLKLFVKVPMSPELAPYQDMPSGDYRITVVLSAENVSLKTITKTFLVHWAGSFDVFEMKMLDQEPTTCHAKHS